MTATFSPINMPQPLMVTLNTDNTPSRVTINGQTVPVTAVLDSWRIDDEWWREEISRRYYLLALADGRTLTLFLDLRSSAWYTQRYSPGLQTAVHAAAAEPDQIALAS